MSAELSDGLVKVSFDLGSGTGRVLSIKRHNDGRWKSFTMARMKKQGDPHTHHNTHNIPLKLTFVETA